MKIITRFVVIVCMLSLSLPVWAAGCGCEAEPEENLSESSDSKTSCAQSSQNAKRHFLTFKKIQPRTQISRSCDQIEHPFRRKICEILRSRQGS